MDNHIHSISLNVSSMPPYVNTNCRNNTTHFFLRRINGFDRFAPGLCKPGPLQVTVQYLSILVNLSICSLYNEMTYLTYHW